MYEAVLGLSVLCFIGVAGYFWRSPAFSVFHPLSFYLLFHGLLFVFRPILAWVMDYKGIYYTYQFMPTMNDKIIAMLAANLGFLAFAFFCLRAAPMAMQFRYDAATREERRRLSQVFIWVAVICAPPAIYSLLRGYGGDDGNFAGLTMDKATGVTINTQNIGYITDLQLMLVPLCAIVPWLMRFRLISFLPLIGFVLLRAGVGGRGPFVTALVATALFYLYEKRIRYPGIRVLAGTLAVLALFSTVGSDRGAGIRQAIGLEEADSFSGGRGEKNRFLEGMDFGNLEYMEYLVYVIPQRSGTYDYFLDNLQVFTEPVPRVLWSGKPVGEPFRRIFLFDYGFPVGMTKSLPGEGWYALGWLGVVIWCGLWGHTLGYIYRRFVQGPQTTLQTACYMVFLPMLIVCLRDGILLTIVRQTGVHFTPIAVWLLVAKYIGLPSAARLRQAMSQRPGTRVAGPPGQPAAARAALPPAVRRRRAALQGSSGPQPAE